MAIEHNKHNSRDSNQISLNTKYHQVLVVSCTLGVKSSIYDCHVCFLARDAIYTSLAYATMSVSVCVRLSVTEVHWRIIANLGFKFRSHFTTHCGCRAASSTAAVQLAVLLAGGSSRAMLGSARFLVFITHISPYCVDRI